MTPRKLQELRAQYTEARDLAADLERQISEAAQTLRKTIEQKDQGKRLMFIHPDGTRWVTTKGRNNYNERHIWEHDGVRKGAKIFDSVRLSNAGIRLAMAEKDL